MPRQHLPLQIFEPRYLQMIEDALKTPGRLIGMIQPADESGHRMSAIGCAGRIVAFSEMEDHRLMISLRAISRFRLGEVEEGFSPYLRGRVDWGDFSADLSARAETADGCDRAALMDRLRRFAVLRGLEADWDAAAASPEEVLINSMAMLLPLAVEEKQALLESPTLADRRELLNGLLEYALRGGDNEEKIQ